jgi:hypothetical protein
MLPIPFRRIAPGLSRNVWLFSAHDRPVYKRLVLDELIGKSQPRAAAQIRRGMTITNIDVFGRAEIFALPRLASN